MIEYLCHTPLTEHLGLECFTNKRCAWTTLPRQVPCAEILMQQPVKPATAQTGPSGALQAIRNSSYSSH